MGKPINYESIQRMMDENPDDYYPPDIADLRFNGSLKRMMGVELTQAERDALKL
jgi:hypothetical protein